MYYLAAKIVQGVPTDQPASTIIERIESRMAQFDPRKALASRLQNEVMGKSKEGANKSKEGAKQQKGSKQQQLGSAT